MMEIEIRVMQFEDAENILPKASRKNPVLPTPLLWPCEADFRLLPSRTVRE